MTQIESSVSPYLAAAYANDRAHVFHSWSAQGALQPTGQLPSFIAEIENNRIPFGRDKFQAPNAA